MYLSQTADTHFTLKRLDIDNPTLTRPDGSQYTVDGGWELWYAGSRIGQWETGTGVDVLPGSYDLVVTYYTENWELKTERHHLTL